MNGAGRVLLDESDLRRHVARLGAQISAAHPGGVVLVGVLTGSFCFVADLARSITVPCRVDFLALSAFGDTSPRVRVLKDLDLDVRGLEVVLVEDIVDTGLSAGYVMRLLHERGAAGVALCALLDRPGRRVVPLAVDHLGVEAPDGFLVGYGLDCGGRYRNLPAIHEVDPAALALDPAAYDGLYQPAYRSEAPPG